MKTLLAAALALALTSPVLAGAPARHEATACGWEALFRNSALGCAPLGPTRGIIVCADGKHPRRKARLQGVVWKGKTFHADGSFTNRWLGGLRAISEHVRVEPSWLDGEPCLVMEYAPDAPVFANVRDEVRQLAPDLWLGRSCDAATGHVKNWFLLRTM
jgi:hypothetical protein